MAEGKDDSVDSIDEYLEAVDDRLEPLCDTVLKPRIEALEKDRLKVRGYITRAVVVIAIPVVLYLFSTVITEVLLSFAGSSPAVQSIVDHWWLVVVSVAVLAVIFSVARLAMPGMAAYLNYRRRFKTEIVSDVFKLVVPDGTYEADRHVSQDVVDESRLFSSRHHKFTGDDLVRGRIADTEFEVSEIHATSETTSSRKSEKASAAPNLTDFHGLFFHFHSGRPIRGHTIVEPDQIGGRLPGHRSDFENVPFEDEAFDLEFRVYSTDASEARQLLSPPFRARLLKVAEHLRNPPLLSFTTGKVFLAVHYGRAVFEPEISRQISYGSISGIAELFALAGLLVKELEFGANESSRRSATSIASRPAAATFPGLDPGKEIKGDDLLSIAAQHADERDADLHPPPESRVQIAPFSGEGFAVSYGVNSGYWVRLLWVLALTPFVAAGVAQLAGPRGAPVLRAITARVPAADTVAQLAADRPVAFSVVVFLFYLLQLWWLLHAPRGAHIGQRGLRVTKRAWPIARTCPLDQIDAVEVHEHQVLVRRKARALLRRYILAAPPMRSKDEARWLAGHFKRALAMFGGLRS